MSEGFSRVHVRNVDFHYWDRNGCYRVSKGNGGVRISARIEHHAIEVLVERLMEAVNECALSVALEEGEYDLRKRLSNV